MKVSGDFQSNKDKSFSDLHLEKPSNDPQNTNVPAAPIENVTPPGDGSSPLGGNPSPPATNPPATNPPSDIEPITWEIQQKWLEENGLTFKSQEDLINRLKTEPQVQEKEVVKEVNPYEGIMDEQDIAYFKYKKETGRSRKDYEFLQQDFSKKSVIDLARDRIRTESGLTLTNDQADEYLEQKLNIDLSDEITTVDNITLNQFAKPFRDQLIEDQKKYAQPLENRPQPGVPSDMIKLDNGQLMPKAQYDALVNQRNEYLSSINTAANSVADFKFSMEIDSGGVKRPFEFNYQYSKEDRHSMVSDGSDIDATIANRYNDGDNFNHTALLEGLWWSNPDNRNKALSAIVNQARADAIQEITGQLNNRNYNQRPVPTTTDERDKQYGSLTGTNDDQAFGVKFAFPSQGN